MQSPKKREFVEEILSLCKLSKVIAFAIGLRYPQTAALQRASAPNTFLMIRDLVERVETMMEERFPSELAVMVFDSQEDQKDKERALEFGNYLYGTAQGRRTFHVSDTPVFASSKVTKGLQISDLVAYALAQQNMGRDDLSRYCDRVREMEWRGEERGEGQPWRGSRFRDVNINEQRIGDAPDEANS